MRNNRTRTRTNAGKCTVRVLRFVIDNRYSSSIQLVPCPTCLHAAAHVKECLVAFFASGLIAHTKIHSFIHSFICSASNTCLKHTLKTYCTVNWTLIVAHDKKIKETRPIHVACTYLKQVVYTIR